MPFNKVIYDGDVLIDLTDDTVSPGTLLQGITAHDKSGSVIEGQIPTNESVEGVLQNGDDVYHIPAGYHDGSGTVQIDDAEKEKLIPGNVRKGVTLLGVEGIVEPDMPLPSLDTPGTAADLRSGKQLIDQDGLVVEGSMPEVPRAVPSISVDPTGLITATTEQSEGYVSSGTESETQQLSTDPGQTVTPSTESQTAVTAGKYMTGSVVVDGDEKLLPENIKSGVSIFGVEGSYAPAVEQATPSIDVGGDGLITASATQEAGYVSAGTKSATKQLDVKNDSDLTVSDGTVTAPAGYYPVSASKAVPTAEQATPEISVGPDGLITASATQESGYVSGGTKSTTEQLDVKDDSDLIVSEGTVTAPAGYYPSPASKAVPEVAQATPSIAVSSEGLITASATQSAGYVASGTKSATKQLEVKDDSDLTVSGGTVTAPAGYYPVSASKTISTVTQATPSIVVDSTGLITASATQSAGYVVSGTKSATKQLTTQGAKVVKPSTSTQTAVASGSYTTGDVTVQGDSNLKASNIKDGISIFGVEGTYTGQSLPSLSTPGTASDLKYGKQLIDQNGDVITGSMSTLSLAKPTIEVTSSGAITATVTQSESGYLSADTKRGTYQLSTQATKTVTPGTSRKTVVAPQMYTTGTIYVQGDTNLVGSNIKDGVSIFGVEGTYTGQSLPSLTTPGTAADLKSGKQLINQSGSIVTGSMPTVSWAKPTMRFQTNGTINVTATQDEGFIEGGDQTATAQFPSTMTSSGGTYTPTTSRQTIVPSARWTTGYHYMAGDANLVSGNIRKGISIFNVTGTYEGTATPSYTTFSNITASVSRTLDPTLTFSISPSVNAQQLVACAGMLYITGTAYSPYAGSTSLSNTPCIYYYLLGSDAFLYIPTSPQDAYFALSMLNNTNTKISGSTLTLDLSHDTANSATWYLGVTSARFPGVVKVVYI